MRRILLWGMTLLVSLWQSHGRDSLFSCFIKGSLTQHYRRGIRCHNKNLWSIEECLEQRDTIKFLDGSWYHKGTRNGRKEFEEGPRIPGANYWDMDDIATSKELFPELNPKGLRVMFPPKAMDIRTGSNDQSGSDDQIVIYGRRGCFFTPRIWYILRTFGHAKVGLLQGSLEDWISAGGPVETHPISYNIWAKDVMKTDFYSNLVTQLAQDGQVDKLERILDQSDVMQYLSTKNDKEDSLSVKLFDTRGVDNFAKGHIPGATSIPYKTLVEPDNALKLKPRDELQKILKSHNVDKATDTIWLSCGSGVSVCHLALALDECGYSQKPWIYDGSWNEWGSDPTSPKAVSLESEVTESSN